MRSGRRVSTAQSSMRSLHTGEAARETRMELPNLFWEPMDVRISMSAKTWNPTTWLTLRRRALAAPASLRDAIRGAATPLEFGFLVSFIFVSRAVDFHLYSHGFTQDYFLLNCLFALISTLIYVLAFMTWAGQQTHERFLILRRDLPLVATRSAIQIRANFNSVFLNFSQFGDVAEVAKRLHQSGASRSEVLRFLIREILSWRQYPPEV